MAVGPGAASACQASGSQEGRKVHPRGGGEAGIGAGDGELSRIVSFRNFCWRALAAVPVAALLAGWGAPAVAQTVPPPDQSTTPTTNGLQALLDKLARGSATTAAPPAAPAPAAPDAPAPGADPGTPPPPPPVVADAPPPPGVPAVISPEAQALANSISRTPGRNTSELLAALHQLTDVGLGPDEAKVIGMGHFPVAGEVQYGDDFLEARAGSTTGHQGEDMQASEGTPIRASEDGTVTYASDSGCGNSFTLTTATGYYLGCHLVAFADLGSGTPVTQGQIIGFVGNTGASTGPHLHFEVHPGGGGAVNPKPILNAWLDEALANVPKILATYQQVGLPKAISYAGSLRRFDEPLAGGSAVATLVAASSTPGIRRLSELRASRGLTTDAAKADAATVDAWKAADQTSRSLLSLLTPGALQTVLVRNTN